MFPGGIADKAGNRYEAKWAVLSLLYVITGRADAIRFESLEKDAEGFEFQVHRAGLVEWHQTKRLGRGNWTPTSLEREGVLTNFGTQLALSPANRCVFVSGDPAKEMRALVEKALVSDSPDQFDKLLTQELRPSFLSLQTIWSLTPADSFFALQRCEFKTLPETEIDNLISVLVEFIFDDPADAVFAILREYLERNLNRLIATEAARADIIAASRLQIRNAALDPTLRENFQNTTERYLESYVPFGCGGYVIHRRQSHQVIDLLTRPNAPAVVLMTGVAGSGKSGIAREVIGQLRHLGVPVCAFRVDRSLDVATAADLGQRLVEQRGNPCTTLSRLFRSSQAVMVVDQIDAVSEASGRIASIREVVFELIDTAWRLENVRLLLVCRSFDLDNDARLKMLAQNQRVERIDVHPLEWEQDIKPVLISAGINIDRLALRQQNLLSLPLNLSIFLEVAQDDDNLTFTSTMDLFDRLVERKDRALRQKGIHGFSLLMPLAAIAGSMSTRQLLDVPLSVLDSFAGALDFLASEHLITRQGSRIAFFHESFFDYVFSREFVRGGGRIVDFLASDEQHLFRRTQVRQILAAYRQAGDQPRYIAELRDLLLANGVRYHLKDAVARWLGTVNAPTNLELDVVLDLDRAGGSPPALLRLALYTNPAWFPLLRDRGVLERWLARDGDRKIGALLLLETAAREYPDDVVAFLRNWWNGDPRRNTDIANWFSFLGGRKPQRSLLNLYLDVIRSRPLQMLERASLPDWQALAGWIKDDPTAAGEVVKAWSETWFSIHPQGHPFERGLSDNLEFYWLGELAKASEEAFLDGAVPTIARTVARIEAAESQGRERDWTWRIRHRSMHLPGAEMFLELTRVALRGVAEKRPNRARVFLAEINPASHPAALYLHLEAIAGGGAALADLFIRLITIDDLFDAGPSGADWISFAEAARSALPHLPEDERDLIETLILNRWPEFSHARTRARDAKQHEPGNPRLAATAVVRALNASGFEQWAILKTIGEASLSAKAYRRAQQLERKFKGNRVPEPNSFAVGHGLGSPISKDRASYMTDDQWLEAIRTHNSERVFPEHFRTGRGGAAELAQILQTLAKDNPARFVRLMPRIPDDSPHNYRSAILRGLAEADSGVDQMRQAIVVAHNTPGKPYGREICHLIAKRPAIVEDSSAFNALGWYIEHGEAQESKQRQLTRSDKHKFKIEDLINEGNQLYVDGLNSIRGGAAEALAAVIWDCPTLLKQAVTMLKDRIQAEPLGSVRCSLMRSVYSVLHHDRRSAAELMRCLIERDDERDLNPLLTFYGVQGLYYVLHGAPEIGRELLDLLLDAGDEAARLIGAYHLFREAFGDDALAARAGPLVEIDLRHRLLAADVAAANVAQAATRNRAETQLLRFFDDPEKDIRDEAAECFRNLGNDDLDPYRALMSSFIASRAFETASFGFFMLLKNTARNVHTEVIAASERLIELVSRDAEGHRRYREIHYLGDLIVREYAGLADKPDQRRRVLDIVDRMLELGLYGADKIVSEHERA